MYGGDYWPTPLYYDWKAVNCMSGTASITISTDSSPFGTIEGKWYIAVPNWNRVPMRFDLLAQSGPTPPQLIDLTNSVPYSAFAEAGGIALGADGLSALFRFTITNDPGMVVFNVANAKGNVDLYVSQFAYPTTNDYMACSTNLGASPEGVLIVTNDTLISLNGDWYLSVYNSETTNVGFDISASLDIPTLTPISAGIGGVTFSWPAWPGMKYDVDYTTNLNAPFGWLTNYTADGTNQIYVDPTPVFGVSQGYYRLKLLGFPGSQLLPPAAP
jgi:hypothetical protein